MEDRNQNENRQDINFNSYNISNNSPIDFSYYFSGDNKSNNILNNNDYGFLNYASYTPKKLSLNNIYPTKLSSGTLNEIYKPDTNFNFQELNHQCNQVEINNNQSQSQYQYQNQNQFKGISDSDRNFSTNFNTKIKTNNKPKSKIGNFFNNEQMQNRNNYHKTNTNKDFNKNISLLPKVRYFIIKSIDEENIHKSIKYRIWCSTFKGNQKLNNAFIEADNKYPIYLFFSVNGSGRFLGVAQMSSMVDDKGTFNYWSKNDKWKGFFFVVWQTIKDVTNKEFKHLLNGYNENKPVTSSRDTQEVSPKSGYEMLKIFQEYSYESSILDDFNFYERKFEKVINPNTNINPNKTNRNTTLNEDNETNYTLNTNDSSEDEIIKNKINYQQPQLIDKNISRLAEL